MGIYVYKVKGKSDLNRKAMIYFRGGGAVLINAKNHMPQACKLAVDCDMTVFNIDYRNAPEAKSPCGIMDCYSAVKYIHTNYDEFNIDPNFIGLYGESAGAYMAAGVSMVLANKKETHMVKTCFLDMPMVSALWLNEEKELSEVEKDWKN